MFVPIFFRRFPSKSSRALPRWEFLGRGWMENIPTRSRNNSGHPSRSSKIIVFDVKLIFQHWPHFSAKYALSWQNHYFHEDQAAKRLHGVISKVQKLNSGAETYQISYLFGNPVSSHHPACLEVCMMGCLVVWLAVWLLSDIFCRVVAVNFLVCLRNPSTEQ